MGVCVPCARTCHAGHELGARLHGAFYCDCGAGELGPSAAPCCNMSAAPPERALRSPVLSPHTPHTILVEGAGTPEANGHYVLAAEAPPPQL